MPGTIIFKPIEANITSKDKDILGKMDPYCLFHVGHHRVKGQVCKSGGNHPVWNDEITIDATNQTTCTVDVKDKDMLIDENLGTFEVDLREIESQGQVRKWYPLFHKNKPTGEVLLEAFCSGGSFKQPGVSQQSFSQGIPQQGLSQQSYGQQGFNQGLSQQNFTQPGFNQGLSQQSFTQPGFNQGLSQQSFTQPGFNQGYHHGSNLGGSNLTYPGQSHLPTSGGILPTSLGTAPHNYAEEALLRGVDPTNLHQKLAFNNSQTQGLGGQNLTQPSSLSGVNELVYEGDVNRFNHPPQQMPFGHGHHTPKDPLNPLNPNQNLSGNKPF